ncbi:MAG: hypothetical protein KH135_01420, partial [Firmicutes bacterium]|nr:hypothetical protein [Bacillota bacterium]
QPGASATYNVTVSNRGSLDASLASIKDVEEGNKTNPTAIKYRVESISVGDSLLANTEQTFQVIVTWDKSVDITSDHMEKEIKVTLNYEQKTEVGGSSTPSTQPDNVGIPNKNYFVGEEIYYDPTGTITDCELGKEWTPRNTGTTCYKWNVIKDNGNNVEMLVDHNIGSPGPWLSKADFIGAGGTEEEWNICPDVPGNHKYGPITAMRQLKDETKNWNKVELFTNSDNVSREVSVGGTYTVDYSGMKARLISAEELSKLDANSKWTPNGVDGGVHLNVPEWLYGNLGEEVYLLGYWTDTARPHERVYSDVWSLTMDGYLEPNGMDGLVEGTTLIGLRPVVRVKKFNM